MLARLAPAGDPQSSSEDGVIDASNDEFRRLRAEYESANDTRREELDSRHSEHEQHLKQDLELCTEILSLVEMLTGDTAVAKAFMGEELRSRLAGMLLSVVRQFTGTRSLDIKISNPDAYGFDPKDIPRVGRIACALRASRSSPGRWRSRGIMMSSCSRVRPDPASAGALASISWTRWIARKAAGVARGALDGPRERSSGGVRGPAHGGTHEVAGQTTFW